MVDTGQAAGGVGGAVSGAAAGSVFGPVGTVVGGILGAFSGILSNSGDRSSFRANRRAEFFRNQALKLQASQITRAGGRVSSTVKAQAAGGNVAGASISAAQLRGLIDVARQNSAIISGVSDSFQDANAPTPGDTIASPRTRAFLGQQQAETRKVAGRNTPTVFGA